MKLINVIILIVFLFLSNIAYNQDLIDPMSVTVEQLSRTQRDMQGRQQIKDLKNGVLIVRMTTNDKAVKKLENILNNPNTSEASKKRIREKTLPKMQSTSQGLNDKIRQAFVENYTFSEVYFMPDTCTNSLQKDYTLSCLTDVEGKSVSGNVLTDKGVFLADYSELENDKTSRIKGLMISNKNSVRLVPPFPYFQRAGGVFANLSSNNLTPEFARKMVRRWNEKLHKYFEVK